MRPGQGRFKHAGPPDHPRLFIAVPLPPAALEAVAEVVEAVRAQPLPPGMRDVRWVRMEGLHLTLSFIGPVDPARVAAVEAALVEAATDAVGGEAILAGTGTFPAGPRPRTIWIDIVEGQEVLQALAARTPRILEVAGKPPDDRPFRAHLTVARSDGLVAGPLVASRLAAAMGDRRIPVAVDRLVLFESVTGGGPARYRNVATAGLGDPRETSSVYHPEGSTTPADPTRGGPGSP